MATHIFFDYVWVRLYGAPYHNIVGLFIFATNIPNGIANRFVSFGLYVFDPTYNTHGFIFSVLNTWLSDYLLS